jgi:hypothetical protein
VRSSETGGSAGLVDEDEFRGIKIELGGEPVPALLQNVRAPLLLGVHSLFLNVTPWRSKKRQSTETEKRSPQFWIRRSWISSSVQDQQQELAHNIATIGVTPMSNGSARGALFGSPKPRR